MPYIRNGKHHRQGNGESAGANQKGKIYIPGPDHFVLQMASFANYKYFMESLREVVMTTEPEE